MNLTIDHNNNLLDEFGATIGPVFDSIANGVAAIPDVQRAFEAFIESREAEWKKNNDDVRAALDEANTKLTKAQNDSATAMGVLVSEHEKEANRISEAANSILAKKDDEIDALKLSLQVAEESLADHQSIADKAIADAKVHLGGLMEVLSVAAAPVLARAEKAKVEKLAQISAQQKALEEEAAKLA